MYLEVTGLAITQITAFLPFGLPGCNYVFGGKTIKLKMISFFHVLALLKEGQRRGGAWDLRLKHWRGKVSLNIFFRGGLYQR